jgi:hypothetical protein
MMSAAKRFCSSSTQLAAARWRPVIDDIHGRLPDLQLMLVGRVRDRRCTPEIVTQLNQVYPWPSSLKHVRRLHQVDCQLSIVLYPNAHDKPLESSLVDKYFHDDLRLVNVPVTPCLLKWQYDKCLAEHWPGLAFRENKLLEQTQLTKNLTDSERTIVTLLEVRRRQQRTNDDVNWLV